MRAYADAGHVAEQSISAIRTVVSFGGETKQAERYDECLSVATKFTTKQEIVGARSLGIFQLFLLSNFALSFWYVPQKE